MSKALRVTPRALKWSSLYSEIASRSRCGLSVRDQIKRVGRPDGTNYTNSSRLFSTLRSSGSGATSSNPQMNFPCLDHLEKRSQSYESGPEPQYSAPTGYQVFHSTNPLALDYGGILPEFEIAFETWGELNEDKSNAILIHTGLSASSHARSHEKNPAPGWWEKFIGPGLSIDTDKFFVICTNVIGGCFGSTGPSSIDPADGQRYATRFPILSIQDVVRAQHRLITERLSIKKLFASVGSSMGGQQSLAFGCEFPESVDRIVSISGCARSHPYSIAMRHTQRQILMSDPNWKRGFYYDSIPPHSGMKLAREVATITYRSGPEWEMRFGRDRADPSRPPALCPDFLIETYLDHQGEKWCFEYDPNSFLYLSKAMDLFDLGVISRKDIHDNFSTPERKATTQANECALPKTPYNEQPRSKVTSLTISDLIDGMLPLADHKVLVIGVESDLLFPAWQQREIAKVIELVQENNSEGSVEYIELSHKTSMYGHDTFLLDLKNVGGPIKKFLEA